MTAGYQWLYIAEQSNDHESKAPKLIIMLETIEAYCSAVLQYSIRIHIIMAIHRNGDFPLCIENEAQNISQLYGSHAPLFESVSIIIAIFHRVWYLSTPTPDKCIRPAPPSTRRNQSKVKSLSLFLPLGERARGNLTATTWCKSAKKKSYRQKENSKKSHMHPYGNSKSLVISGLQ